MSINKKKLSKLKNLISEIKIDILNISFIKKAHHIGSIFSCIDILVVLYFEIMNDVKKLKTSLSRDYFLLSKGHAALGLYTVLSKKKFFSKEFLINNYLSNGGKLGGHPDTNHKLGIDFSSGSLGHSLSVGIGIAIAKKDNNRTGRVYVLVGDGELNEGMIWEAIMFASSKKLKNITLIVDYNNLQGIGYSNSIITLDSLEDKFVAFGWVVSNINGHNIKNIINCFNKNYSKPHVIIAKTIKGNGLKTYENKINSHYFTIKNKSELEKFTKEIK
jgi:transketolase